MDMFVLECVPSFDVTIEGHTFTKPKLVGLYVEMNVSTHRFAKPLEGGRTEKKVFFQCCLSIAGLRLYFYANSCFTF